MDFDAILDQAIALLQRRGRLTYGALKRQFQLDDEYLADLKAELIDGQGVAADEDGKVLVWTGGGAPPSGVPSTLSHLQSPASYTPPHLVERIRAEQAAMEARGSLEGERKTITALFADLKGSTALIEGLDPEEARAIIDPALQLMMDAVHRYEGYVAQALGDGIFALFGAPIAHEDHPQRALYAALRMQEEMRRYADTLREKGYPPLLMRVGINTGEVVVRSIRKDDLHADYVPVGHSTNLAARMEQLAAPGSILVTEQTHKLTDGYFEFKALGKTPIKGVEVPLLVYEVMGAGPLRTRFQVAARRGLTRFVGRQSELEQMQQALEQAKAGHGQIVGVMGEPGLGKSRLFYEFKLTSQSGCLVLEAYSVSHGKASPYLPVIELLKSYFQIQLQDDERQRKEKVTGRVLTLDRSLEDALPYLSTLLSIDDPTSSLQQMDPQIRRRRTFEAFKRLFLRESLNQPLILVFEDLHWIDSETQGILDMLSESVASARILVLANYRPEYRHEWGQKTYYTQLRLAPLGKEEAEELLIFLLGADVSLKTVKQRILEKTEGTPFFMEEVVQTLAEEGVLVGTRGNYRIETSPTELHVSPTVQGVLAARIDRLETVEKELLQQLSVVGRQFPLGLVRKVVTQSEDELYRLLSALQGKEFLYEQPAFPEVEYIFKHALTQEVAYGSVLIERRKALHEQTARAIEALYRANLDEHYNALAHHYSQSGNTEKAIAYLGLAGQQSVQRSANTEAVTQLTRAVELLQSLPDNPVRIQQELGLQTLLGGALIANKGYASPEVEHCYARAVTLCRQVGETPQLFPALLGLWACYTVQAKYTTAHELAEQLLRLAQTARDALALVGAYWALGETVLFMGRYNPAHVALQQGISHYDSQQHAAHAFVYGQDNGVACLIFEAWALWFLGYPEQALKRGHEGLSLAQEVQHLNTQALMQNCALWLFQFRREVPKVQERAEGAIRVSTEHGLPQWQAMSTIFHGWALAEQGHVAEGATQTREGIAAWRATGADLGLPYFLALEAEAYLRAGQPEEGLRVLDEALATVDKTEERVYEAELYRLYGELSLRRGERATGRRGEEEKIAHFPIHPIVHSSPEECFQKALDIARKQQAKSLELRAVMSLARLWQQQGKTTEAHQMLSKIYNWFTEGFDTVDLKEAKGLLEELYNQTR